MTSRAAIPLFATDVERCAHLRMSRRRTLATVAVLVIVPLLFAFGATL